MSLESALASARAFPIDMAVPPFANVIWDPVQGKMIAKGWRLAVRLLKYMCDLEPETDKLLAAYQTALQNNEAKLPDAFDLE